MIKHHVYQVCSWMQADWNVIVVGWDMGSRQIWYPQSASDTRAVGAEIALVADNLIRSGDSANSRLYCVGHSLGGHVCGHAGARTKFGRITGWNQNSHSHMNIPSIVARKQCPGGNIEPRSFFLPLPGISAQYIIIIIIIIIIIRLGFSKIVTKAASGSRT